MDEGLETKTIKLPQANQITSPLFDEANKEWDIGGYLLHQRLGMLNCWKNTLELPGLLNCGRTYICGKEQISVPVAADGVIALSSMYTGEVVVATES